MVEEKVFEVFSTVMGVPREKISKDTSVENLEVWDSVQHLNLILSLEEEFSVKFSPEEIQEMLSIEAILSKINEKLKQ